MRFGVRGFAPLFRHKQFNAKALRLQVSYEKRGKAPAGKEQVEPALPVIAMESILHIYRRACFSHRAIPE